MCVPLRTWILHVWRALRITCQAYGLRCNVHTLHDRASTNHVIAFLFAWSAPTPRPKRVRWAQCCFGRLSRQGRAVRPISRPKLAVSDCLAHVLSTSTHAEHAIGARVCCNWQITGVRVIWLPTMAIRYPFAAIFNGSFIAYSVLTENPPGGIAWVRPDLATCMIALTSWHEWAARRDLCGLKIRNFIQHCFVIDLCSGALAIGSPS